jgi:hypothetical protein
VSHKDDHRLWRVLVRFQTLAWIPEEAQLDGEPEPIDGASLCSDDGQVFGVKHVVPRYVGGMIGMANRRVRCSVDSRVRRGITASGWWRKGGRS